MPTATTLRFGSRIGLRKIMGRTPEKDISKATKIAGKGDIPSPTPFGPQKPSTLPQRALPRSQPTTPALQPLSVDPQLLESFRLKQANPVLRDDYIEGILAENIIENATRKAAQEAPPPKIDPRVLAAQERQAFEASHKFQPMVRPVEEVPTAPVTPAVPEDFRTPGGIAAEAPPIQAIPTWVDDVQKAAREPADKLKDLKLIRDVVTGKKLYTTTIKGDISPWAKNLLRRLEMEPERALEFTDIIEEGVRSKATFPKTKE